MSKIKDILEKIRPDNTCNKQARHVERVAAITHASDAVGWRPVPYTIPDRYAKFLQNLDSDIESIIEQAGPDQYNPRYFERTVDEEVDLALKEVVLQQIEHARSIASIHNYQKQSIEKIQLNLARLENDLEKVRRYRDESYYAD